MIHLHLDITTAKVPSTAGKVNTNDLLTRCCALCFALCAAAVRARTANLVGNMCRHSGYFYTVLQKAGVLVPLIKLCSDPDKGAR